MNAIEDNAWSRGFASLTKLIPRPKAIVAVSAHWYTDGIFLTRDAAPKTIHDFGGFPAALFEKTYPAPGAPALAKQIAYQLGDQAGLSDDWGLDHGTWSVLTHLYPKADIPVVQLSIDAGLPFADHVALGKKLAPLRQDGVLIFGTGNIVHNLRDAFARMRSGDATTPTWSKNFDAGIVKATEAHDHDFLVHALDGDEGRMAHPTPEHYLPLLYVAGAASKKDKVSFPITGFDAGSLSMRSVLYG